MVTSRAVQEIERIEADDSLHDFAGPHSGKGADFPQYWLITRLLELESLNRTDYLFVCEYVQDVAEFDSTSGPTRLRLYQLKKREGSYWQARELTGQTKKSKAPKSDAPVFKLLKHVRAFKSLQTTGAFITNGKFEVPLASGESSVNDPALGLHLLDTAHTDAIKAAIATEEGVSAEDVDLSAVELCNTPLAIGDLDRHTYGVMLDFLASRAPEHVSQARSFVDTLFTRLKARARRTEKSRDWSDLIARRGFCRSDFKEAVESLEAVPDKAAYRKRLFEKLSMGWNVSKSGRVIVALAQCAREKVLIGQSSRWTPASSLAEFFASVGADKLPDEDCFAALCAHLAIVAPDLRAEETNALAIWEMTEWALNQTPA